MCIRMLRLYIYFSVARVRIRRRHGNDSANSSKFGEITAEKSLIVDCEQTNEL